MANVKIVIDGPLMDGHKVTFKAPCACTEVEKLDVRYVKDKGQVSKLFTLKDTHGNDLTGIGNLFEEGAYVHVILDSKNGFAYIQNADTNGYLEGRFSEIKDYIVEQGQSGVWTYRKWESGIAECWCNVEQTITFDKTWDTSIHVFGNGEVISYPFEFVDIPICNIQKTTYNTMSLVAVGDAGTISQTPQLRVVTVQAHTNKTIVEKYGYQVVGRWK